MSLKEEIRALKEKEATLAAELGNLKKTFLESEISRDLYDEMELTQEQVKVVREAIEEKTDSLRKDMMVKIDRDYKGLPVLKEQYETLVDKYSMDAGVMIRKAIKTLIATDLLFQTDLACKLEQLSQDVARNHSTASEVFTDGLLTRQDLGLVDLEAMAAEIARVEAMVPGSDAVTEYIDGELSGLEVTDVA